MGAIAIERVACMTFTILFVIFEPKINVNGADEAYKELEKSLPAEYKSALAIGSFLIPDIWNGYSIQYFHEPDNVITIIYSGPYKQGWVGIGLSKTGGMLGSSAMVGWTGQGGKNIIKQFSLQAYSPDKVIANKGELQLTKVPPFSTVIQTTLHMAFQLRFPNNNTIQNVIFASSPGTPTGDVLVMHKDATTKVIDFHKGRNVDSSASMGNSAKTAHGAMAFLGWVVLIPVGILFPAYFKHLDPLWFKLHRSIQIAGYILAFITVLLGLNVSSDMHIDWVFHKFIGITVLFLATLQVLAIYARPLKDAPSRKYWNMYHHGVGYTAALLALCNFLIGLLVAHSGLTLKIVFAVWFIGLIVSVVFVIPRITSRNRVVTDQPPVFNPAP